MEWNYLKSEVFALRQALAAHCVQGFDTIIEIGSYAYPISRFLTHPFKKCVCIDPLTEPLCEGKVEHRKEDYREADYSFLKGPYALVLLGMDLPVHPTLFTLLNGASKVVVEVPKKHIPSKILLELIRDFTLLKERLKVQLDFSENDFGDLKGSHPLHGEREFYVLEP